MTPVPVGDLPMTKTSDKLGLALVLAVLTFGCAQMVGAGAALSGELSEKQLLEELRKGRSRSISHRDRELLDNIAKTKPSVDIDISFEFNSANISRNAIPLVTTLGNTLGSNELDGDFFLVAGHTDAKGGDSYNQALSERRAQSVRR